MIQRVARSLVHLWPIVLILLAWDLWVRLSGFTRTVAPAPSAVLYDLTVNFHAYVPDLMSTVVLALLGLILGIAVGALGAIALWFSGLLAGLITPGALILRSVPITAMIPILARIFGYEWSTVLLVTVIVCFFPAFVLTASGLSSTPEAGRDLFAVLGASKLQRLVRLHLPHALPNLLMAVRLMAPAVVLSAMLAEFLLGQQGLGYLMVESQTYRLIERAWGVSVLATALSLLLFGGSLVLERRVLARIT